MRVCEYEYSRVELPYEYSRVAVFKARFKLKPALARFILTTIELLCLFTKIKMSVSKLKLCL